MCDSKSSVEPTSGENRALKISSSAPSFRVATMSSSICSALPAKIGRSSPSGFGWNRYVGTDDEA
jgi:hypothetical protein